MELFDKNGCLTDEGLQALQAGGLDELGRLETAEHLAYCDKCMDRYTALLTADALETPPHSAHKGCDGRRLGAADAEHMGPRCSGRCGSSAGVHHVALRYRGAAAGLPAGAAQLGRPVEDGRRPAEPKTLGRPVEDEEPKPQASFSKAVNDLLFGAHSPAAENNRDLPLTDQTK